MSNYHVVRNEEGDWAVKRAGADRISGSFGYQKEAERAAKQFAANTGGGEVRIHDIRGRIRDSDTVKPGNESSYRDKKH